jgi:hypothetical protein
MRLAAVPREFVRMPVVLVVDMAMVVFQRFVRMFVFVSLADVQPYTDSHQRARDPEKRVRRFSQQQ